MFIIYAMCGQYICKCYLPSSVLYLGMENWDCSGSAFLLATWCYYSMFLFQCFFSLISPFSFHPGKITQFNDNDKSINGQHIQCLGNVGTVYVAYSNCNWSFSLWTATGRTTANLWLQTYFLLSPVSAQSNVCPGVLYNIVHDYTHTTYKFWLKLLHEVHVVPIGSLRLSRKNSYMYLKGTLSSPHPHPTQGEYSEIPRGRVS